MNPALLQAKHDLADVLAEYQDVTLEHQSSRDNAIDFWLKGKKISYHVDLTNTNARSDFRRQLNDLGALPRIAGLPRSPPPAAAPVPPVAPAPQPRSNMHEGCTIFQSHRVIGIEIDHDLLLTKDTVLVIPLHRPNTLIELPREQFHLLFDEADILRPAAPAIPAIASAPIVSPEQSAALRATAENNIVAFLQKRNGAVKSKLIANELGVSIKSVEVNLRRLQDRGIAVTAQPGFWTLASKPTPTMIPKAPTKAPTNPTAIAPNTLRSRNGVSPQVGRILVAMAQATKTTGKTDLVTSQVTEYLDARDGKQYGARLPSMVDKGWAARGLPLAGTARGWHYHLTAQGQAIVKELGAWPYEYDGQLVPPWVAHVAQ